jgi:DDE domain
LPGLGRAKPDLRVDGHPAYASATAELKETGELGRRCRCRPALYLNNIIEQDHRFIKKRIAASLGFRSAEGAWRTIEGYEAMHAIRKGQIRWVAKAILLHSDSSSTQFSVSQRSPTFALRWFFPTRPDYIWFACNNAPSENALKGPE